MTRNPTKAAFFIVMGVVHPGDLIVRADEVLMNEGVVIGEKNTEAGMRVIPAHDTRIWELGVLHLVDVLPSVLRECDVRARLRRILARNAFGDTNCTIMARPNQHATNFRLGMRARVLPDPAKHVAVHHYGECLAARLWLGHVQSPSIWDSGPNRSSRSPAIRYAISAVEVRPTKISNSGSPRL